MANGHTGNIVIKSWILHIMRNDWNVINNIDFNLKVITNNHYKYKNRNKRFLLDLKICKIEIILFCEHLTVLF